MPFLSRKSPTVAPPSGVTHPAVGQTLLRAGSLSVAALVVACLQGCVGEARYLEARGKTPSNALPFLPPTSGSRAEVRVVGGVAGTTRPKSEAPGVELDLSLHRFDGQADGIVMVGPGGMFGFRSLRDGGDIAAGILARPGRFRILGSASLGLRSIGFWRLEQTTIPPYYSSDDSLRDTTATSKVRWLPVAGAGLACSYVLGDERWTPFLAFQAQAGPGLAGETGITSDTPLSFGSISGDAGMRLRMNSVLDIVAAGGIVQGTGVFTSSWPRAWASLDWKIPR